MTIQLTSVSPFSFDICNIGDVLSVRPVKPKPGEYRGTIGAATQSLLVFKGNTKIGMIPSNALPKESAAAIPKRCRVTDIDATKNIIAIEVL